MITLQKNHKVLFILTLVFYFTISKAGTFHVMINADAGIPAVDTLVQQGHQSPRPDQYLMDTLTAYPPESVNYLISNRPTGYLLDLVNQNPMWSQARLYRYVTVKYLFGLDVTPILESFQNDSLVEVVGYQSSVLNTIVFDSEPLLTHTELSVNVAMNSDCEEIGFPGENVQGITHNVVRNGSVIELEVIMLVFPPTTTICGLQSSNLSHFDLGQLEEGDYTLKIYKIYGNPAPAFPVDESARAYLGERSFEVLSPHDSVQAIPSLNVYGLMILLIVLLVFTSYKVEFHRRS